MGHKLFHVDFFLLVGVGLSINPETLFKAMAEELMEGNTDDNLGIVKEEMFNVP
jgi:hypothetical protein